MQRLADLCVSSIAQNIIDIETCKIIETLEDEQRDALEKLLPSDLPADIALSLNLDEDYWKQRCESRWETVDMWLFKGSWKSLYVHRSVQELIDSVSSNFIFSDLLNSLAMFRNYVYELNINGLPFIAVQDPSEQSISLGTYAGKVISMFPNVEKIKLYIIPQNCGLLFDLQKFTLTKEGYDFLFQSILQIKNLKSFTFICPGISASRISQLTESLYALDNLSELNISCNIITDDSSESIKKLLALRSLQNLILSNNNIGNEGAIVFSPALKNNSSLKFLDLSRNCIGNSGAISIFENLLENNTLEKLDMKENIFRKEVCDEIIKLLDVSPLQFINLSGNKLQESFGKALTKSLNKNKNLIFLGLKFCELAEDDQVCIQQIIEINLKHHDTQML